VVREAKGCRQDPKKWNPEPVARWVDRETPEARGDQAMAIERFENIEAWRAARELASAVYTVIRGTPIERDFALRDQMQRAAISVMANIAEGFDSRSDREFVRFLSYAYRSASELQSHVYVARDQIYLDQSAFDQLYEQATIVKKLLNGFIRYLQGGGDRT
jgi:four helix bundle protein